MHLGTLYHWSPSGRYTSIDTHGLLINQEPVLCTERYPMICASPDPAAAWNISAAAAAHCGVRERHWDLWMIRTDDGDELHPRPEYGPKIVEVQIRNAIPRERIWWVGRRTLDRQGTHTPDKAAR